ncbi:histone PARylation factor 1-like isoform X3 [Procambarus clarkii]|uniref:histone PARylation factor 1-like isoform X3 n=1 Tax=Procambarus clarkii TaxID=6728 RepID=UPI001E67600B|nr:histone PARylation factor 1-like isoform X1 [Procambarus clarkii]
MTGMNSFPPTARNWESVNRILIFSSHLSTGLTPSATWKDLDRTRNLRTTNPKRCPPSYQAPLFTVNYYTIMDMWGSHKKQKTDSSLEEIPNTSRKSNTDEFVVPASEESPPTVSNSSDQRTSQGNDKEDSELPIPQFEDNVKDFNVAESPEDVRFSIEQKFLLEMPDDFFDFWDCCSQINKEKPEEALMKAGLTLVGPYDVLTGKLKGLKTRKISSYVCHWRYYYDPPEFMTVVAGDENEYHIGYYRDDPFALPSFVASMSSIKPGNIKPLGENIFAGVCSYLTLKMKEENPFKKVPLQRLYREIELFAKKKKYSLEAVTQDMKKRNKQVVAKTFHGAGIVVPMHGDVGYREVPETPANLRRMFQKVVDAKSDNERRKHFDDIQELITNVQFAYDEGDFGMGLELGLDLFSFGSELFHKPIYHVLGVGYDLLGREPYIDILQAHLKNRRRGNNMSILEVVE